jgi:amino acid adenylation domain-containing protein
VDPARGIALLEAVLGRSEALLLPLPLDPGVLRKSFADAVPPLWRGLVRPPRRAAAAARRGAWASELASMAPERRLEAVLETVRGEVARALSMAGAEAVEADRPLKELGLDSLMAVQLRNALGRRAGVKLPATLAFDYPTPAAIAKHLLEKLSAGEGAPAELPRWRRERTEREEEYRLTELSLGQERLWFFERLAPGSALYHVHFGLKISGRLDTELVRACLAKLVKRHEVLRTTFLELATYPDWLETARAVISPVGQVALDVVDLREAEDKEAQAARLALEHRTRPFEIGRAPMWRSLAITLAQHHMITDAWSVQKFGRELAALYEARGRDSALGKHEHDYSDFVRQERALLRTAAHRQSVAWWKERLAGLPRLDLPCSSSRPMPRHQGEAVRIEVAPAATERLREFGRREGCTLFVTLLTAWACVLHRYSGQTDFAIGTMATRRDGSEFDDVQGFFINMLVLRCDVSGAPTFRALAQRMQEVVVRALEHRDVEFSEVALEHEGSRDRDLNPLIQASFDLIPALRAADAMEVKGARWDWAEPVRADGGVEGTAKFNLGLSVVETAGGLVGTLEYATDLFDASTVERMASHLAVTLEAATRTPERCVGELPLLTEWERQQLVAWNATAADYARDKCVHELFADQAARTPEAVAVIFEDSRATYGELDRRSNQLAHRLRELGVGAEVVVGLCVQRSIELVVGLLGILKAGGAYLPLDPSYPQERLAYMLQDSAASVLVTQSGVEENLGVHCSRVVLLDNGCGEVADRPATLPASGAVPENLCYIIYTSGSTGRPKGVMATHRGIVNRIAAQAGIAVLRDDDVCCQKTSIGFVDAVFEIFGPLTRGVPLAIVHDDASKDPNELISIIARERITHFITVPSLALALTAEPRAKNRMAGLRSWTLSGEALSEDLLRRLLDVLPKCRFINLYGSSEVAADATCYLAERWSGGVVPIGRPMGNTQVYVLDKNLNPVPLGMSGELYVGGAGLARGYVGRPDLTAERFVPDPFGVCGGRLYRTGDIARWRSDGELEYSGRVDHQVKIRGYRIELGEIETVLTTHPAVTGCAVIARAEEGASQLVAYYVCIGEATEPRELQRHLRRSLPEHMIPAAFVALADLPLSPNSKVDRKALAARDVPQLEEPRVKPRDGLEQALADIWKDVLSIAAVDASRTFFEHGGNSLKILRVQQRIRAELAMNVAAADLFKYPTIDTLAGYLGRRRIEGTRSADNEAVGAGKMMDDSVPATRMSVEEIQRLIEDEYEALP